MPDGQLVGDRIRRDAGPAIDQKHVFPRRAAFLHGPDPREMIVCQAAGTAAKRGLDGIQQGLDAATEPVTGAMVEPRDEIGRKLRPQAGPLTIGRDEILETSSRDRGSGSSCNDDATAGWLNSGTRVGSRDEPQPR